MLVLSRRVGEEIVLPDCGVTIRVVTVAGNRVRLGIAAPPAVTIHRAEVVQRIRGSCNGTSDDADGDGERLRVLIADADRTLLLSYRDALVAVGFTVDVVVSGLDCVAYLRHRSPHVLVLDPAILWGGGDGVLTLMREEGEVRAVPVLVHASPGHCAAPEDMDFPVCARVCRPLPPEQMAFLIRQIAHDRAAGQGRSTAADGSAEWRYDLRRRIAARTQGRVVGLKVEVIDGRLIVQGRSQSYYGKQLACAAALDLLKTLDSTLVTEVELNVEVLNSRQCIVKATNAGGWRRTKLAPSRE